jgi:Tol biopolymer transport system component
MDDVDGAPEPQPTRWGEFDLIERVVRRGESEIWRAHDPALDRDIALLVLPAGDADVDDVLRRARLLARVRHQKLATIYGATRIDAQIGIAMEFAGDTNLAAATDLANRLAHRPRRYALGAAAVLLTLLLAAASGVRYLRSSGFGAAAVPSVQQLQFPIGHGNVGRSSLDGRILPFVDRRNGALAVMHVETGAVDVLMNNGDVPTDGAGDSVASPDGSRVAFQWLGDRQELRVIDLDSRRVSIIWQAPDAETEIIPTSWSPNGRDIAGVLSPPNGAPQLFVFRPGDRAPRILHAGTVGWPSFSDDGQSLVFQERDAQTNSAAISVLDFATNGLQKLDLVGGNDVTPFWSGGVLTFASERAGGSSVWRVSVDPSGHVLRAPQEVPGSRGISEVLGVTPRGLIIGEQRAGGAQIMVANLDGSDAHEVSRGVGSHFSADWSSDGHRLAYLTEPPAGFTHVLKIHDFDTGTDEALDGLASSFGKPGGIGYNPRLSPDGRRVLLRGPRGFFLYDFDTRRESGGFFDGRAYGDIEWDDDSHVFVLDFEHGLSRVDLDTGKETRIYTVPDGYFMGRGISVSPDRTRIAYVLMKGPASHEANICVVNRDGSNRRVVLTRTQRFYSGIPGFAAVPLLLGEWTMDGRDILYAATEILPNGFVRWETDLWAVPVDGGTPYRTGLSAQGLRDIRPAPDGKRVAYTLFTAHTEVVLLHQPPESLQGIQ